MREISCPCVRLDVYDNVVWVPKSHAFRQSLTHLSRKNTISFLFLCKSIAISCNSAHMEGGLTFRIRAKKKTSQLAVNAQEPIKVYAGSQLA